MTGFEGVVHILECICSCLCSFRRAGQLGPLTRLLPCTKEELKSHTPIEIKGVNTYVAPSFAKDSEHNDNYPPYNKPGAITHWLRVRMLKIFCMIDAMPAPPPFKIHLLGEVRMPK